MFKKVLIVYVLVVAILLLWLVITAEKLGHVKTTDPEDIEQLYIDSFGS